ncbi:DUF2071 domain-containing protein [Tenacibaculum maritimum]|uniref:DUF2071 domain-containing protein n=1 Tax=Tenacibaculum maritimum TaxID=107401 RepID=UPI00388E3F81
MSLNTLSFKECTTNRIKNRAGRSFLDVHTMLEHFCIISYKVPVKKIAHFIPEPFKLWTYIDNGEEYALVSAVPFMDQDFCFYKISKRLTFSFFQTNFRTYIIDKRTHNHAAWFFGTTLGSMSSIIPKRIWNMPWQYATYNFEFDRKNGLYTKYQMYFTSKMGNGTIAIKNTGNNSPLLEGFNTIDEQIHILTHPVIGYYNISETKLGTYEIWHPKMDLKEACSENLYFELFEKLGFLTKQEMNSPHSILTTPFIEFDILLPPKTLKRSLLKTPN